MKTEAAINVRGLTVRLSKRTHLATVLALLAVVATARATVRYVDVNSTNPTPPHRDA